MMGLGSIGHHHVNNNNNSSSNLSALAPPFSIHTHRSNPNTWQQYPDNHFDPLSMPMDDDVYRFPPTTTTATTWSPQPPSTYPTSAANPRYDVMPPSGLDLSSQLDYMYAFDYPTHSSSNLTSGRAGMEYGTPQLNPKTDPHTNKPYLDLSFLPYESPNNSVYSESHSRALPSETHNHFSGYQNSLPTYASRPAPQVRPSSSVVIRPPPVNVGSSPSAASNKNISPAAITDFVLGLKSNSQNNENPCGKDLKLGISQSFVSPSVKELSTPLNVLERNDKTSHVPQFPNVNVSNGFDTVQVVAATEVSPDSADHHSLGVDSPCWRGVNSSQFSSLYVEDDFSSYYYKNSVDELYDIGHEMKDKICSAIDSTRTSICAGEVNKNQETEFPQNGAMHKVQRNSDAVYSSREPNLSDTKAEGRVSTRSIGVQIDKDPNDPIKESCLPNNWMNGFDMDSSKSKFFTGKVDTGLTLGDVSDGNVAVHAAEKVLASPSSQEDTAEGAQVQPDQKMDVPMIIEAIRSLSESLLLHLPNDFSTLDEKNTESLKLVINNLSSCMSKKIIKPTNAPNLNCLTGVDSKTGESCDKIQISDKPHKTSEIKNSHADRDYWSKYDEVGDVSDKKPEKSPGISLSGDDSDITGDDMSKAIKKVLDENLNLDEEMHPQALLFKSLWLEAEAKLCSISYKARFDRMKLQIEKSKPKTSLGKGDVDAVMAKNHSSPKEHDEAGIKPMIGSSSLPMTSWHAGDVETSFSSRLSILKSRDDEIKLMNKEKQKSEITDGDDFVMARLKILKSRGDNSKSLIVEEEKVSEIGSGGQDCLGTLLRDQPEDAAKSEVALRPHLRGTGNHCEGNFGSGHKSLKELNSSMANDQMIHPLYDARMMNLPYSGWHGSSSSSDWEHVLKDDFAWKNS